MLSFQILVKHCENQLTYTFQKHTWTFHIHEVWIRRLNQPLFFMFSSFFLSWGMQEIFGQLCAI